MRAYLSLPSHVSRAQNRRPFAFVISNSPSQEKIVANATIVQVGFDRSSIHGNHPMWFHHSSPGNPSDRADPVSFASYLVVRLQYATTSEVNAKRFITLVCRDFLTGEPLPKFTKVAELWNWIQQTARYGRKFTQLCSALQMQNASSCWKDRGRHSISDMGSFDNKRHSSDGNPGAITWCLFQGRILCSKI
jgi:hypothetical protein